jgi:catechol 2,3-dioxygenase
MPAPTHIFDPPFNIVRCSHVVLDVVDLNASCAFYEHGLAIRI